MMEPIDSEPTSTPGPPTGQTPLPAAPLPPASTPPAARPDYSKPFFWVLVLCILLGLVQFTVQAPLLRKTPKPDEEEDVWSGLIGHFGPGITVVKVYGTISMPDKESYYGGEGAQDITDVLHKLRKRDDIKGVVLRVNSPGGSVGASQEIYDEVKALSALNKKVVVSMGDMAASGGYYISAPADYIFVNPGTITGSIGVITEALTAKELIDKLGLQMNVFKSGTFKDMGNFARQVTPEERALYTGIVMGAYDQFVKAVAAGRVLTKEMPSGRKPVLRSEADVRKLADGRIYLGSEAVKNGLADAEGSLWDAISKCGEMAGLGKEPTVMNVRTLPPLPDLRELFRGQAHSSATESLARMADRLVSRSTVPVMYLYRP